MAFDEMAPDMKAYIQNYGYHFNKKMCDLAVRLMERKDPNTGRNVRLEPWTKEQIDEMLKRNGVTVENDVMHDVTYMANMIKADRWKSSVSDEAHLCLAIKDELDDADQREGHVFVAWYAKMMFNGCPIDWYMML